MKRMKMGLLTLVVMLTVNALAAQLLVVKTATSQGYASGACCARGVDYVLQIRLTKPLKSFVIDSVWIEDRWFPAPDIASGRLSVNKDSVGATYAIHETLRWMCNQEYMLDRHDELLKRENRPPQEGDAVICYRSNKVPHRLVIGKLTELFPIPYP